MSEKVAPECTAHPDTKAGRRSSLSAIADEGIRAAGSGHRSSIAGRRNSVTTAMIKPKPLGCGIKSAYSLPRLVLSGFDYTIRPARVTVYREAFGMPIMTMSMLVSICKSFDFLLGFLVGKLSDSTRTRWGRRKPWIAAFSPIFIVVTLLLASPGLFFSSTAKDAAAGASTCASHATKGALNCTALKQCLDIEIAAGSLPAWDSTGSTDGAASASSYSTGLAVYFATLYFMHYVFGWTATMIPYDALGMELTTDYDDKTSLFGMKVRWLHRASRHALHRAFCCFCLFTLTSLLAMCSLGGLPVHRVHLARAGCVRLLLHGAGGHPVPGADARHLLRRGHGARRLHHAGQGQERGSNPNPNPNPIPNTNPNPKQVKERPMTELQRSSSKPVVPSMRAMLANKPYMMYLLFNVPFKLAALIPINVIIDYLKFNAKVPPSPHHPPPPTPHPTSPRCY